MTKISIDHGAFAFDHSTFGKITFCRIQFDYIRIRISNIKYKRRYSLRAWALEDYDADGRTMWLGVGVRRPLPRYSYYRITIVIAVGMGGIIHTYIYFRTLVYVYNSVYGMNPVYVYTGAAGFTGTKFN